MGKIIEIYRMCRFNIVNVHEHSRTAINQLFRLGAPEESLHLYAENDTIYGNMSFTSFGIYMVLQI